MSGNNFDKFTPEAKKALLFAEQEARAEGIGYIGTEHLLLGVLSQKETLGSAVLQHFGITQDNIKTILQDSNTKRQQREEEPKEQLELTGFAKKTIRDAVSVAYKYNHSYVGTEHILYALVMQEGTAAVVILEDMKISSLDIQKKLDEVFQQGDQYKQAMQNFFQPFAAMIQGMPGMMNPNGQMQFVQPQQENIEGEPRGTKKEKSKTPALDFFTHDLTQQARDGKLDPVIGRKKEIDRMIAILNRKTKNNPVLIGEPGVGKTALAEGLARAIASEDVPSALQDKKVLSLDMSALVAGTKYRGEFEARLKQVLDEASSKENEIILFIDELHTVIGAGSAEGSLDAANMLKPLLGRGKIRVVGATTIKEYRKHVEADHAFERRFQPVMVDEPNETDAIQILDGLKETFEEYHNLRITDAALKASVILSSRYIQDRFLPDKAIDLLDEACSLRDIERSDKDAGQIKSIKKQLEKSILAKEEAVASQDYVKAGECRDKELALSEDMKKLKEKRNMPRGRRPEVSEDDIAHVVSKATGVPITKLIGTEIAQLKTLEGALKTRIVGQDEAVKKIAQAIRRSRVGLSDAHRPIGSFIFMGPTGVGKTALVKALAKEVFHDDKALLKFDMSEMMERHNVSRLVGTTAGYVGYEEGGQLTEAVRKKPYSIVLFDEIEKAHPDVYNLLLQILEDGYVTDGKGRRINFRNTIIIMTSNVGAERFTKQAQKIGFNLHGTGHAVQEEVNDQEFETIKKDAVEDLKKSFKPEMFNRIDGVIVFKPLGRSAIEEIVSLELSYLQERLSQKNMTLFAYKDVITYLAQSSYDPKYGARPVRRKLQEVVEDGLSDMILEGDVVEGDSVLLYLEKDEMGKENPKLRKLQIADQVEELVNMRTFRESLVNGGEMVGK